MSRSRSNPEDEFFEIPAGLQKARTITVRTSQSGFTGGLVRQAAHVLGKLLAHELETCHTILELGSGTGFLAMLLAATGADGTRVIATDAPPVMKPLRFNIAHNHLLHAVQCLPWDWNEKAPPKDLDLASVTLCVASDVIYYDEHGGGVDHQAALARTLHTVLCGSTSGVRVLLLVRVRLNAQEKAGGTLTNSLLLPAEIDDGSSSVASFIATACPQAGLECVHLPVPKACSEDSSYRFLEVTKSNTHREPCTDPVQLQSPITLHTW